MPITKGEGMVKWGDDYMPAEELWKLQCDTLKKVMEDKPTAHAEMTDLERSRSPLYGLTEIEFGGCHLIQYTVYNPDPFTTSSWTPFECYKLQWQAHRDAASCLDAAIRTYQQNNATYNVPVRVREDMDDGCAMLMTNTPARDPHQIFNRKLRQR